MVAKHCLFVVLECKSSQIVAKVSCKCCTWFVMHIGDMGSHQWLRQNWRHWKRWELGELLRGRGGGILLHIKKDVAGKIERYKAWLIAKGFTQVYEVDYYETFTPVAKLASIRTILTITACNNWPINIFNFHSACLNGQLDEDKEVFIEQLSGYEESDPQKCCVRLYTSLYGLK